MDKMFNSNTDMFNPNTLKITDDDDILNGVNGSLSSAEQHDCVFSI